MLLSSALFWISLTSLANLNLKFPLGDFKNDVLGARVELATLCSSGRCSNQLSYPSIFTEKYVLFNFSGRARMLYTTELLQLTSYKLQVINQKINPLCGPIF